MEVLTSFSFDRDAADANFDTKDTVHFSPFSQPHGMSLTQFSIYLGLYDQDYADTIEYIELLTDYPHDLTPGQVSMIYAAAISISQVNQCLFAHMTGT